MLKELLSTIVQRLNEQSRGFILRYSSDLELTVTVYKISPISPNVVLMSTFPCVGGSVWYIDDMTGQYMKNSKI